MELIGPLSLAQASGLRLLFSLLTPRTDFDWWHGGALATSDIRSISRQMRRYLKRQYADTNERARSACLLLGGNAVRLSPKPNEDGWCHTYRIVTDDNYSNLAAECTPDEEDIEEFNENTGGWNGCDNTWEGTVICLSKGNPPCRIRWRMLYAVPKYLLRERQKIPPA